MAESSPLFGFDPAATTVTANYSKVAEAQGDIADAASLSKSQKAPFDFLGLGQAVTGMTTEFANQKNKVDAHTAKMRALDFMNKNQNLTGHELANKIEGEIKNISGGEFSTGYREGALSVFEAGYAQALDRKEEERVASSLNVIQSDYMTVLNANKKNNIPVNDNFAENYALEASKEFKLPIEQVRNAMVSSYYQEAGMLINAARNKKELAQAEAYLMDMKKSLKSPLFLDSRSKKFAPVLEHMQTTLNKIVTAKEKEFKQNAALFLEANIEGDGQTLASTYPVNPLLHQGAYADAYDTPAAALNKFKEDVKSFNEAEAGRTYINSFNSKAFRPTAVPDTSENKYIKPEVTKIVTNDLMNSFNKPQDFITIVQRNQDVIKESGDNIARIFNSTADPQLLSQYKTAFDTIANYPGGSQALQLALGNNYKDIMATMVLADGYTNGDVLKARNVLFESQGKLTQGVFTSKDEDTLHKYKAKLGSRGSDFEAVIHKLRNVNESLAAKEMENIYKKFAEGVKEVNGVKMDVGQHNTSSKAYEPDLFNSKVVKLATDINGGLKPGVVTNLANNGMSIKDTFGFTTDVVNSEPLLNLVNQLSAAKAVDDARKVSVWTKIGDHYDLVIGRISEGVRSYSTISDMIKFNRSLPEYEAAVKKIWDTPNGVLKADGSGEVPVTEVAKTIAQLNKMYPIQIDPKDEPDYDLRKSLEAKNVQARVLIQQVADELVYGNGTSELPIDDEYDPYNIDPATTIPVMP